MAASWRPSTPSASTGNSRPPRTRATGSDQALGRASTSTERAMRTSPAATRATCRCAEMASSGAS
eukprot:12919540-Alexandrium_andersonii.AAC.1